MARQVELRAAAEERLAAALEDARARAGRLEQDLATARSEADHLREELARLMATKTMRALRIPRAVYRRLRSYAPSR